MTRDVTADNRCECYAGADGYVKLRCGLHAAAPAMLAALRLIAGLPRGHDIARAREEARKAIRAMENA